MCIKIGGRGLEAHYFGGAESALAHDLRPMLGDNPEEVSVENERKGGGGGSRSSSAASAANNAPPTPAPTVPLHAHHHHPNSQFPPTPPLQEQKVDLE